MGVEPEEWRVPSRQLLTLRRFEVGVPTLLVAVALVVAGAVSGSGAAFGFAAAALIVGALLLRFVGRRYGSWGYAEREEDLLIRRGVMFARGRPARARLRPGDRAPAHRRGGHGCADPGTGAGGGRDSLAKLGETQAAGL